MCFDDPGLDELQTGQEGRYVGAGVVVQLPGTVFGGELLAYFAVELANRDDR